MHDLAAFVGRLIGTMADPLLWFLVFWVLMVSRGKPTRLRVAVAVLVAVVVGAAFYSADPHLPLSAKAAGLIFAAIATPIICAIMIPLLRRLERRQRA